MNASSGLRMLTRVGFAARGLLYIVIALLLLHGGRSEDPSGALVELGQRGGHPLLLAMAAGLAAYGLWRLVDAAVDIEGHGQGPSGIRERLGAAASGIVHALLAVQAVRLLDGSGGGAAAGSGGSAFDVPGGPLLLTLAGALLIGVGVFQLVKAYKCKFCDRLDGRVANLPAVRWMGRAGYSARGAVFMVSGYFFLTAGLQSRASEAAGMEEALRWLDSPIDLLVAVGLLLFGLFSLVEARFRVIHAVPLGEVARAAGSIRPGV